MSLNYEHYSMCQVPVACFLGLMGQLGREQSSPMSTPGCPSCLESVGWEVLEAVEETPSAEPLPGSVAWPGGGPPAAPGTRHGLEPHPDGETKGTSVLCLFHWPLS